MKKKKTLIAINKAGYERKNFSIHIKEPTTGWRKYEHPDIDLLNSRFSSGKISYDDCFKHIKEIRDELYRVRDSDVNRVLDDNRRIADEYYAFKYLKKSKQRRLAKSTLESTYNDLTRAISSIGQLSLQFTKIEKLQEEVDKYYEDYTTTTPHAKSVMRLNALLKFMGRPERDRLESLPQDYTEVKNLSFEEAKSVITSLDGIDRTLSEIAYFSGLRLGEIFSLTSKKIRKVSGGYAFLVDSQMLRSGEITLPKRRKIRRVFALQGCKKSIEQWVDIGMDERRNYRNRKVSQVVQSACIMQDTSQTISFKDWRHCYAINLLNGGATISQVASNLGNSEAVCKKHYIGYILTNDGIDIIAKNFQESGAGISNFDV